MARRQDPTVIDFETEPIEDWPNYPPKPVGVSILIPGKKPRYYAWGHKSGGNNCTKQDAATALKAIYKQRHELLCHNSKFDLDVAWVHFGLEPPAWDLIHDTMYLLFLADPYSPNLKLKPAAERLLGMPPEEKDAIRDWCIANKLMTKAAKECGHLIHRAPGTIVGPYANGDCTRTLKLFKKLMPEIEKRGMLDAYNRERRLMPILLRNEHQGVPVDLKQMAIDDAKYARAQQVLDDWLRRKLRVPKDFNLDSDEQLADALIRANKAAEHLFLLTPTGKMSTAKNSLIGAVTDKAVLNALQYRSRLGTAYGTFLHPWFIEAKASGGVVHPSWNQVRQAGQGSNTAGARTGRLSVSRFMNVPKEFEEKPEGYQHPSHIKDLPELPFMRSYMVPFKGEVWCKRDYMQQELRVLGHFGDGELMEQFCLDADLDVHDLAAKLINEQFGIPVTRKDTKTIGFGLLYGMGLGELSKRLGVDTAKGKQTKEAYLGIFPELKALQEALKEYANANVPLTTWGGRQYYCEEPKWSDKFGRWQTFEYKMLNYLIQGSSADCTKEAIIRYDQAKNHGRFLVTVHDELDLSVPAKYVKSEMQLLREVMASVEFDVPMLSDGSTGQSWGSLKPFDEPAAF